MLGITQHFGLPATPGFSKLKCTILSGYTRNIGQYPVFKTEAGLVSRKCSYLEQEISKKNWSEHKKLGVAQLQPQWWGCRRLLRGGQKRAVFFANNPQFHNLSGGGWGKIDYSPQLKWDMWGTRMNTDALQQKRRFSKYSLIILKASFRIHEV